MIRRGTYADVGIFSTYLAGYGKAPVIAKEEQTLLKALESTRERIDRYVGWRSFQPVLGTKHYDAYVRPLVQMGVQGVEGPQGVGGWVGGGDITYPSLLPGVTDIMLRRGAHWTEWLYPDGPNAGAELNLGTWLCGTPTSVTLTPLDLSGPPITLAEGWDKDYTLLPAEGLNPAVVGDADMLPAERLRLTPARASSIVGNPYRLAINGSWGWSDERVGLTTLGAELHPTDVTMTVATGEGVNVWAGQTHWIESEQVYVRHVPSSGNPPVNADTGIIVDRGVNGTVAVDHANATPVSLQLYNADAAWCSIEIARNRFRGRIMGALATFSEGRVMLSETEEKTLQRLDSFFRPKQQTEMAYGFA